jgi:hypothetical protein
MITLLLILIGLLAVVSFFLIGAVVEMYRMLHLLTKSPPGAAAESDLLEAEELALDRQRPSALGLPAELDEAAAAVVVFVSDSCGTCADIAAALRHSLPTALWVVVVPAFGDAEQFAARFHDGGERVLIDREAQVFNRLGLFGLPSAVTVAAGELATAHTVGNVRQLYELLPVIGKTRGES